MMKVLVSLVLVVLVIGLAVVGCAEPAPSPAPAPAPAPTPTPTPTPTPEPAEPINLRVYTHSTQVHLMYRLVLKPWCDEVEQLTGGRVKTELFHSGALGPSSETYALAEKGVCDVTAINPVFQTGRFPLQDVSCLPYILPQNARDKNGKLIRDTILEKYLIPIHFPPEEVHIMWHHRYLPKELLLRDNPIRTEDDGKGMVIGHPGGKTSAGIVKSALLASPESVFAPDMYLSLERGLVDACFYPFEVVISFKLWEVMKYITVFGDPGGDFGLIIMNAEKWASLPPDIQEIMNDLAAKYKEITMQAWIDDNKVGEEFAKGKGIEVIRPAPEVIATWKERTKHIPDEWAKDMDDRGLQGTAIVNEIRQLVAESQK